MTDTERVRYLQALKTGLNQLILVGAKCFPRPDDVELLPVRQSMDEAIARLNTALAQLELIMQNYPPDVR